MYPSLTMQREQRLAQLPEPLKKELLGKVQGHDPETSIISTLELERHINTFFRLQSPGVIARLREKFPELGDSIDERTVFLKLRELRNHW